MVKSITIAMCLISFASVHYVTCCFADDAATQDPQHSAVAFNSAMRLEDKARWREAQTVLAKIIQEQPNFYLAYTELCRCYLKVNDYKSADRVLNLAQKRFISSDAAMKPVFKMRFFLESRQGQLDALQKSRREYVARFPDASDTKSLLKEIDRFDKELASTRGAGSGANWYWSRPHCPWYQLNQMPSMPIKILIAPDKSLATSSYKSLNEKYSNLAKKAALAWAKATDDNLSFSFVKSGAELRCEWTKDPSERTSDFALGQMSPVANDTQRILCNRAVVFFDEKKPFSDEEFYEVCLHELGHALGLQHSSNPADLMYWSRQGENTSSSGGSLSKGDVRRIRTLYTYPFIGRRAALEFAIAAYIRHDYEKAYLMLTPQEQNKKTMAEFQNSIDQSQGSPTDFTVTHFDLNGKVMNFTLVGSDPNQRNLYYNVGVTWTDKEEFQVDGWHRAF